MNKKNVCYIFIILLISGCAVKKISTINEPLSLALPVKSKTILTKELACFGDMLSEYRYIAGRLSKHSGAKPILVSLQSVKDATEISREPSPEIPSDMTDLALGILSNIGGALRVAHVPSFQEIQNAIYASNLAKQIQSQNYNYFYPDFRFKQYHAGVTLYGALTEYDRTFGNRKNSLEMGTEFGGNRGQTHFQSSHQDIVNQSRMTMDFRAVDSWFGEVVNSTSSTNTVWLFQYGRDNSFGISINGNSIGYANSITEVDARHAAIRLLIELGLIETIGKYERIPYWKCLPGVENNEHVHFNDILTEHKQTINDSRDINVIMDVKRDFEYADYTNPIGRVLEYKPRPFKKTIIELSHVPEDHPLRKQILFGKSDKLLAVLELYLKNDLSLPRVPNHALKLLYENFKQEGLIPDDDRQGYVGTPMYLALWFNAPIKPNARWIP